MNYHEQLINNAFIAVVYLQLRYFASSTRMGREKKTNSGIGPFDRVVVTFRESKNFAATFSRKDVNNKGVDVAERKRKYSKVHTVGHLPAREEYHVDGDTFFVRWKLAVLPGVFHVP